MAATLLVFITARWSDDDPAARIRDLAERGVEEWEIISYPALDADDRALCEEIVPASQLKAIRAQVSSRVWGSLYMSNPVPDDGDIFRRDWFVGSDRRLTPADGEDGTVNYYAAADIATMDGAGDWTVLIVFGVDTAGRVHIVHCWRKQASSADWVGELIRLSARWRPLLWAFGAGALFRAVEPLIRERMTATKTWVRIETFAEAADKVARSQAFAGMMENDRVRWDQAADWYPQAESELLRFPAGRTDDVVDACSLIGAMMTGLSKGRDPAPPPDPHPVAIIGDYTEQDLPDGLRPMKWANWSARPWRRTGGGASRGFTRGEGMAFISATLDSNGATSDAVAVPLSADARTLVAGVTRTAGTSDFDVRLQIGIAETGTPALGDAGTVRWFDAAMLTQADPSAAVVPARNAFYRFAVETRGAGNTLRCLATL